MPPVTCPAIPTFSCPNPPLCKKPGDPVDITTSCEADQDGVQLAYMVNGTLTTNATCPPPGVPLTVTVLPNVCARPGCSYNATFAFQLQSASPHARVRSGRARPRYGDWGWARLGVWLPPHVPCNTTPFFCPRTP